MVANHKKAIEFEIYYYSFRYLFSQADRSICVVLFSRQLMWLFFVIGLSTSTIYFDVGENYK